MTGERLWQEVNEDEQSNGVQCTQSTEQQRTGQGVDSALAGSNATTVQRIEWQEHDNCLSMLKLLCEIHFCWGDTQSRNNACTYNNTDLLMWPIVVLVSKKGWLTTQLENHWASLCPLGAILFVLPYKLIGNNCTFLSAYHHYPKLIATVSSTPIGNSKPLRGNVFLG